MSAVEADFKLFATNLLTFIVENINFLAQHFIVTFRVVRITFKSNPTTDKSGPRIKNYYVILNNPI